MAGMATAIFAATDHKSKKSENKIRDIMANSPNKAQTLKERESADLNQLIMVVIF